jgi:hypothetical protein
MQLGILLFFQRLQPPSPKLAHLFTNSIFFGRGSIRETLPKLFFSTNNTHDQETRTIHVSNGTDEGGDSLSLKGILTEVHDDLIMQKPSNA